MILSVIRKSQIQVRRDESQGVSSWLNHQSRICILVEVTVRLSPERTICWIICIPLSLSLSLGSLSLFLSVLCLPLDKLLDNFPLLCECQQVLLNRDLCLVLWHRERERERGEANEEKCVKRNNFSTRQSHIMLPPFKVDSIYTSSISERTEKLTGED